MKNLDRFGQGRKSVLDELKKYNFKEMQKLQIKMDATNDKIKRSLLAGHFRQLVKLNTLIDVKIKNLKDI